jgi:hypothetical protein
VPGVYAPGLTRALLRKAKARASPYAYAVRRRLRFLASINRVGGGASFYRRPTPLSSAVLAYGGTAAANGSGLTPALSRLRGTYALARSGGGVRSRWSLTWTLRAIKAKRPWPSTASPSTSP